MIHSNIPLRVKFLPSIDASSTKGLVIDLSCDLNTVEIDSENRLAYVGGSAIIWEQVNKPTISHCLALVAETVN